MSDQLAPDTIFISYRRDDSSYAAGWVHARLKRAWPGDVVFLDVHSIRAGQDFPERLRTALDQSRVVLVCIGPQWLNARDTDGQRRLDDPKDFVRLEIAHGLARAARGECEVIPVFLDGMHGFGSVPGQSGNELPDAIATLASKNGVLVRRPPDTDADITLLIEQLADILNVVLPVRFADPLPSAKHQLPSPPIDFTGREAELIELRAAVRSGDAICSLHGMAGTGKTALALKLADELKGDYPDGQIYLDLKGVSRHSTSGPGEEPLTSVEVMSHVIHAEHPEEKLPDRKADLEARYRTVLAGKRVLLLLDNAKDAAQVAPLIPNNKQCLLVVTSRQHIRVGGRDPVEIGKLKPEEAVKLLRGISGRLGEQDAATVAMLCDYLPMALKPAASLMKRTLPPERLIERLRDRKQRLSLKDDTRSDELLNISIEASFHLSYELLAKTDVGDLQQRWRALAIFSDTFDAGAAAAVWETEEGVARDVLEELYGYSMLEFNQHTATFRLHDLARDFADARLNDDERERLRQKHSQHFCDILAEGGELYLMGGDQTKVGLGIYDRARTNIAAGMGWAASRLDATRQAAELCINYTGPIGVNTLLRLRLHPRDWTRWLEDHLVSARLLERRDEEGHALANLGNAQSDLGEARKAIEYHQQALVIDREIGDRLGESYALGNLGSAYLDLGETTKAIEYFEQQLAIAHEIPYRRGESVALGRLANAYRILGETRKAIEYSNQNLATARAIGYRRGEGYALEHLGNAYADLGEMRRAIEFYEQRLVIAREIGDRKGEGSAVRNIGDAYKNLGETSRALVLYEQTLIIAREIGDRRSEGHSLWSKSLALDDLGDRAQAILCSEGALRVYDQIEDPRATKVRTQLAEWGK